ncbi:MAG: acetyltransferase [Coxiellaceae bacterium]|nr:acetyltransferase [Coxiellaceae bacterium]
MNKPLYILGAGGHAKVLLEALGNNITGFLEIDLDLIGKKYVDKTVFLQEAILKKQAPNKIMLVNGLGSVGLPILRRRQYEECKEKGYQFLSVFHRTSYFSEDVVFGEGSQLLPRSVVLTGSKIGANTIINTSSSIDHDCIIGAHVHIAPGCVLSGNVSIGNGCHIGTGAKIIQGVSVGENVLIAAGAVVIHDIPANSRVAGVPAVVF